MKPAERYLWILNYLRVPEGARAETVDIYNKDFVVQYVEATHATHLHQFYGAPTCPQLGKDLSMMYKQGRLLRTRAGLTGMEDGFARWVYVYELNPRHEALVKATSR